MDTSDRNTLLKNRSRQLRRDMTDAERHLWSAIRNLQLNSCKFRRQHPLGHYILDFVCLEARLIIEVDGSQHLDTDHDRARTEWLKQEGYRVLRFWNDEVLNNREIVLEEIMQALEE